LASESDTPVVRPDTWDDCAAHLRRLYGEILP
jgi:hypothetical protein